MNAGIVILQDGTTPCIAYDEPLPHPVKAVEFRREGFTITLVYDVKRKKGVSKFSAAKEGKTFEFPLERRFAELLMENKKIALACIKDGKLVDIQPFSVTVL